MGEGAGKGAGLGRGWSPDSRVAGRAPARGLRSPRGQERPGFVCQGRRGRGVGVGVVSGGTGRHVAGRRNANKETGGRGRGG